MADSTERGVRNRLRGVGSRLSGPNTIGDGRLFWAGFLVVLGLLVAQPLLRGAYATSQFTLYLAYGLLGLSLTIIWGYAGILSFGQVAFFGLAGYTYAIVSLNLGGATGATVGLVAAVLAATLAALVLGYFMFYGNVRDVYVAIVTLVVTLVINTFLDQTAGAGWMIGSVPLGGFNGIPGIENFSLGVGSLAVTLTGLPFYYFVLAVVVAIYLGLRAGANSRLGYALVAIREDEDRAEMLGYDVRKLKLGVFTFSGALAGLGGVCYVTWGNYVSPRVFTLAFATIPVVWVSFGGRQSLAGALVGTVLIEWVRQWFSINASEYAIVFVGVVLLVSILALPRGIVPGARDSVAFFRKYGLRGGAERIRSRLVAGARRRGRAVRTWAGGWLPAEDHSPNRGVSRE